MHGRSAPRVELGVLSNACGAALTLIVALAPLAYACTRPGPLHWLSWALHGVAILWILALAIERRAPGGPRVAVAAAGLFIAYVWVRLWCFDPEPISDFTLQHFARIYNRWPESVIVRTPRTIALLSSALAAGFLVAMDLTRRTPWRRALLYTMVGAGCAVVMIGLLQNATQAPGIFWETPNRDMPSRFFGTFYHFTSAGAFINLTWPIAASMSLYAFKRHAADGQPLTPAAAWAGVALLLLLGHVGHVSRFPQVLAAVTLLGLLIYYRPLAYARSAGKSMGAIAVVAIVLCGVGFWVLQRSGRISDIAARWEMVNIFPTNRLAATPPPRAVWPQLMRDDLVVWHDHSSYFLGERGAAYTFAWECLWRQPVLGFGPGGWLSAVSQYSEDPLIATFYHFLQFTHEDYLQTLVEWGLVGGALIGLLVFGALRSGIHRIRVDAKRPIGRPEVPAQIVGALAALFAVLAQALIDFPLQIPANALYACILLAVCWSSAPAARRPASSKKHIHERQLARD